MPETDQWVQALDPFAAAALRQRRSVKPEEGRRSGPATFVLENYLPHVAKNLASLPERATKAASTVPYSEDYDPGPAAEAALLLGGARIPFAKKGEVGGAGGLATTQHLGHLVSPIKYAAFDAKIKWQDKTDQILRNWKQRKWAKLLEPLDWQTLHSPWGPSELPPQAIEQGYNPFLPLYRGGSGIRRDKLLDPQKKPIEKGIFFSPEPDIAKEYGAVQQYVAAPKNPAQVDYALLNPDRDYSPSYMNPIIDVARDKGHDFLAIKNMFDMGSNGTPQTQYVALDPGIIRYPEAAFDQSKKGYNSLLAGLAGGGVVAGSAMDPEILNYINALRKPNGLENSQ